jgi:putative transcriptional regulator
MKKQKKDNTLGQDIISGLQEILDHKMGKISLRTAHVEIPEPPAPLSADEIQALREHDLKMSQAVFAGFIGVSPATVRSWEHGINSPKGPALRLLHLARQDKRAFLRVARVG